MHPILILREEMVCLILLLFLLITSHSYRKGKDGNQFHRILAVAIAHVLFDGITAWTVNRPEAIPALVNDALHGMLYLSGALFARDMLIYTVQLYPPFQEKQWRRVTMIPLALFALAMLFVPMEYGIFDGTRAGTGLNVYLAFGLSGVYILLALGLVAKNWRQTGKKIRWIMVAMLAILLVAMGMELLNRAALLSGGAVTIVAAGFFFSLENPAIALERKASTDAMTGVENRNGYERDIEVYDAQYQQDPSQTFIFLFADMNNLKSVNGMYGHGAGDEYIILVAGILMKNLTEAEHIYRMGGDEFLAVYRNVPEETVHQGIDKIHAACREEAGKRRYTPMLATGYAVSGPQYKSLHDVLRVADYMMYQNKAEQKQEQTSGLGARGASLNLTGLMDRVFDAMCLSDDDFYPFMTNIESGVTRIAPGMAEIFGMAEEFYENFLDVLGERVHPEDLDALREDVTETLKKNRKHLSCPFRARNREGQYIRFISRGGLYHGTDGEPDLFCGYITRQSDQ